MDNNLEQNRKHTKLIKAHQNNIIISDMNLSDKYTNFEDSKLSESKTLLYEINKKPTNLKDMLEGESLKLGLELILVVNSQEIILRLLYQKVIL